MNRLFTICIFVLALLGAVTGCSDDPATPQAADGAAINGVVDNDLGPFSYVVDQASHPGDPVDGPFILRGDNLHYDDGFGALVVDLTVTNASPMVQPEPVTITFLKLLPDGVTIIDPANSEPTFTFEFTNDDGMWTPGETSLPLTVSFVVDDGVSIAFVAEIGLGFGTDSGVISGHVWHDINEDGEWNDDEVGLGGIPVALSDETPGVPGGGMFDVVLTAPDGSYAFTGLSSGLYGVHPAPRPDIRRTTPELQILLTETTDGVGSFDEADFGVAVDSVPSLVLEATADATVRSDLAARENDNYGADPFLGVGTSRNPNGEADAIRSLVRFDLQIIQRPVISARLEMSLAAFRDGFDQTYDLGVYAVADFFPLPPIMPWIEGNGSEITPLPPGVEWVDAAGGVAWIGAEDGGDANNQTQPGFMPDAFAHTLVVQNEHLAGDVISWDVTRLVNAWLSGGLPNRGLVIRDTTTGGIFRQIWLGSRDGLLRGYTDDRVQPGPRLVLEFQ